MRPRLGSHRGLIALAPYVVALVVVVVLTSAFLAKFVRSVREDRQTYFRRFCCSRG
jgi:hypothetical protein